MIRLEEIQKALSQCSTQAEKETWALRFGVLPVRRDGNSWSPRSPLGGVSSETFRTEGQAALEQLSWLVAWGLHELK